ncbi:MAG: hypothetical protein HY557_00790 [Euryarchaeota archaeon]|nr:hypothetical protein [Euryarchaeota archaeon]
MATVTETRTCRHERCTLLGVDDTANFYECDVCHDVIVAQRGKVWRVQATSRVR